MHLLTYSYKYTNLFWPTTAPWKVNKSKGKKKKKPTIAALYLWRRSSVWRYGGADEVAVHPGRPELRLHCLCVPLPRLQHKSHLLRKQKGHWGRCGREQKRSGWIDWYLMFYAQSTAKGHIRAKQCTPTTSKLVIHYLKHGIFHWWRFGDKEVEWAGKAETRYVQKACKQTQHRKLYSDLLQA